VKNLFVSPSIIGIDGCKTGWVCSFDHKGKIRTIVIEKIELVKDIFPSAHHVLIDIPIGLESKTHKRDLDLYARKHLATGVTSSVFTPPSREAVMAHNYEEACQINFEISGKKISIQSWNIAKKILEVDNLILLNKSMHRIFHESHPEVCFQYLNDNRPLTYRKRAKARRGIDERLQILSMYKEDIHEAFKQAYNEHKCHELKVDDIVDSLCLFVVGELGTLYGFSKVTGTTKFDEYGINLNLYYFDPRNLPAVGITSSSEKQSKR
jgi:predicted RNase H-like nuclease